MLPRKFAYRNGSTIITPNDLISEFILTKNFIHKNFNIVSCMVVKMYINRCCFTHNRLNRHEIFVHPVEILFFIPNIAIHFFLKSFEFIDVKLFFSLFNSFCDLRIATDIHLLCIIGTACKRRVYIYKVNLNALLFEICTSRNTFATNNHVTISIFAHGLLLFHLI